MASAVAVPSENDQWIDTVGSVRERDREVIQRALPHAFPQQEDVPGPSEGAPSRPQATSRGGGAAAQPHSASARRPRDDTNNGEEPEVIDLTDTLDIEIVSSTVTRAPRTFKRPKMTSGVPAPAALAARANRAAAAAAPTQPTAAPPLPESPRGPKCGICLEPMGGSTGKSMLAGPCGHVYCKDCLTAAVKMSKKCPTCRKTLQVRQMHQVFINF